MTSRSMYYILDTQGNPVPARDGLEWAQWFERSWPTRAVAQILIPLDRTHRIFVSAVFLGMDHNWFPEDDDRPILYEMMVFYEQFTRPHGRGQQFRRRHTLVKRLLDSTYQRRYHTRDEAKADFDNMLSYLLGMKAAWGSTPDAELLGAWCHVYDALIDEEEENTSSVRSQNENPKELSHAE